MRLSPRTGQPLKDDVKRDTAFRFRMTEETKHDLDFIAEQNGLSKADMLIRLIREEKKRLMAEK